MKEEKTYREPDVQPDDDVIVIDWMGLVRRAWNCRRLLLKAMGVGLVLGCVVALSIPKKYTVNVTLSPESGQVGGNLSGLASMVGQGGMQMDGEDALGAALSGDIVGSTPFLLEMFDVRVEDEDGAVKTGLNHGERMLISQYRKCSESKKQMLEVYMDMLTQFKEKK